MNLTAFIDSNYQTACNIQRNIKNDSRMREMITNSGNDASIVRSWMQEYGLFQGLTKDERIAIAEKYLLLLPELPRLEKGNETLDVHYLFENILSEFYLTKKRGWISAASKLLWCSYPNRIVIYDRFVKNSVVVLQGLLPYLACMPRIKSRPTIKSYNDISTAVNYYMNYQKMVLKIAAEHQEQLMALREKHQETYPFDLRILDKLLWMLGNPNRNIQTDPEEFNKC